MKTSLSEIADKIERIRKDAEWAKHIGVDMGSEEGDKTVEVKMNEVVEESKWGEEDILNEMVRLLQTLREAKPTKRGERARRYAIVSTELEKVFSYYKTMIVDSIMPDED